MAGVPRQLLITALAAALLTPLAWARQRPAVRDLAPTIILISFDGWRWDYARRYRPPHLESLIARGTSAEGLIPGFPSKTYPSHYTLVTGPHPGHHGIVANNISDPQTGRRFSLADRREVQSPLWWGGTPIWLSAQAAGQPAAPMFWPGSEAPINGVYPRYWMPFDDSMPGNERVDRILAWLDLPRSVRPTFLTLYFSDVDTAGHRYGPDARETRAAVRRVDGYLGRLVDGLTTRGILDRVNLVAVSDHGMSATSDSARVVVLDDYISLGDVDVVDLNPTLGLIPKPGREEAVYRALRAAHPRLRVYRKAETPPRWHYRDHPRIPPLVGVVDEGWQLLRRATLEERRAGKASPSRGEHGYDPATTRSMRGLFVAAGPAFRARTMIPAFENVHVYQALTRILGVPAAAHDGDPRVAALMLR